MCVKRNCWYHVQEQVSLLWGETLVDTWSTSPRRKDWGSWACLAWRREGWEGSLEMPLNICRVEVRRMGPRSFQWCPATGQGATGTNWSTGSSVWTWGRTSSLWGWRSTGTGCPGRNISREGDIQDPPGQGPLQPTVGDPASAGGLDYMTHRGPFQPLPFCDSVILWSSYLSVRWSVPGRGATFLRVCQDKMETSCWLKGPIPP